MLDFQQLKLTYDTIAAAIAKAQEPTDQLKTITRFLGELCANDGALLGPAPGAAPEEGSEALPADEIRYIFEDMAPSLIKKMCRERSGDEQYLETCGGVLQGFLDLLLTVLKRKHFNDELLLACRLMFDYDCNLHKCNFQIPDETLQSLFTKGSGQSWRNDLKEGDMVDALVHHYDRVRTSRGAGWSQAKIERADGDTLYLIFPTETKDADRPLDRWSVEIAPFESKTAEIWEWKKTIKVDDELDAQDDTCKWLKATIISIKEEVEDDGRTYPMACVGMRVYVPNGQRSDDRGNFDGWGDRFDEQIPVYSPRLCPFKTRSTKAGPDDDELDESLDDVIRPDEGQSRVWAVPRPRKCTSSEYMRHINYFCHLGGLESILTIMESEEQSDAADGFTLSSLAILLSLISLPAMVYHKSVIAEFAPRLIAASKKRLLSAPDRALRDVRRQHIEAIVKAVDALSVRLVEKAEREKEIEILKLEVALLCLNSSYMERRIQGIRDLNQIIKNNRIYSSRFSGSFLVEWMQTHGVFDVLFDPKKTHLQLIQRCDEVLKLLLQEDLLSLELLKQFWALTKTDLRLEVFKIVSDCSFYYKQQHLDFIFDMIRNHTPAEKLDMEEFSCLSELGKYAKDKDSGFQEKVAQFFWELIVSKDSKNLELVDNCIQKYRDMVRYWVLEKKQDMFVGLLKCISDPATPSIPCLKLLKGLIKDQSERTTSYSSHTTGSYTTGSYSVSGVGQASGAVGYGATATGGSALRTRAPDTAQPQNEQPSGQAEAIEEKPQPPKELTLQSILTSLLTEHDMMRHLLDDLTQYQQEMQKELQEANKDDNNTSTQKTSSQGASTEHVRSKLFLKGGQYSHHAEIDTRLQFVQFVAQQSNEYCISKKELGVIYDLLITKSCVESDQQEFLTWCKSSCESQTTKTAVLDLAQVGEFFTEKIACKELDVKSLAPVGFEFLQFYFISLNEKEGNLRRQTPAAKVQKATGYPSYTNATGRWTTSYSWNNTGAAKAEEKGPLDAAPKFTLLKLPSELQELKMLWTLVLECERPEVVPRVIDFLIKVHLSLQEDLQTSRLTVLQELIDQCMQILKSDEGKDPRRAVRVIEILKTLVHETEVKGTRDVLAHGALQKGEALEPLTVKYRGTQKGGELLVQVHSNARLWDLREAVAQALDLAPRYLQVSLGTGTSLTELKEVDNGKTMTALGFVGGEVLTAQKLTVDEYIPEAPLIGSDGELTPGARRIFGGWYDLFTDSEGCFTKESAANFIQACCGDKPLAQDGRISGLFAHDGDGDGKLQREEFLAFYHSGSRGEKARAVRENLKAFNVRPDLKKLSEVEDEASVPVAELPRYFMPRDQGHFDQLLSLIDNGTTEVAEEAWELLQMLATNPTLYRQVLKLDIAKTGDSGQVEWAKFFDKSSWYRLLYTLQIVQAVLEGDQLDDKRVVLLSSDAFPQRKEVKAVPKAEDVDATPDGGAATEDDVAGAAEPGLKRVGQQVVESAQEDAQLRSQWAEEFVSNGGFQFILKDFMSSKQGEALEGLFELKYQAFVLSLLRTFIMAAFSTSGSDVYQVAVLARRASQREGDQNEVQGEPAAEESSSFKQLQTLLAGPLGQEIVGAVDYSAIQRQVLRLVSQVLKKPKLIFEDKLILEHALNLWSGCLLHSGGLFDEFVKPIDADIDTNQFVLSGLLYCRYETVREEFRQCLAAICRRAPDQTQLEKTKPLDFILKLLSVNFSLISEYPCKQYFELFCELLDKHFLEMASKRQLNSQDTGAAGQVIDSEALLSTVIERIREENQQAQKARLEGQDATTKAKDLKESSGLFLGLILLAGKILDNSQDNQNKAADDSETSQSGRQQRGLIDEIFTRFLFPSVFHQDSNDKSQALTMTQVMDSKNQATQASLGSEGKTAAYRLLNGLLRRDPKLMHYFLENCMQPLMSHVQRAESWNYTPPSASGRSQEFVGLRNLGCICYMNSMLQQFFAIPTFRYNLLCVDDGKPDDIQEYKGNPVDDNMLHQLQKLMANLELSERQDYDPWEFCFAFKEFDGGPTNTAEQKDAQEFLNLLFERLETALKGTSRQRLLQSVFGGQQCNQLVCSECGKLKNRLEDFYNLSLTVKDIKGVHESLQAQVEGEVISDYECTRCKKKVDVRKRTLITQTPNILVVHLQRIIFDFDTFQNDKINHYFEFPQHLNLQPYSYYQVMEAEKKPSTGTNEAKDKDEEDGEGNDDQDKDDMTEAERAAEAEAKKVEAEDSRPPPEEDKFEYKLVGITVHSGTAHAGHYWAYINTLRDEDEAAAAGEAAYNDCHNWRQTDNDHWMEFNDSNVRDFQASKLKEEGFGGDGNSSGGFGLSSFDGWGLGGGGYGKSGYMLFYERRAKEPLKLLLQETKEEQAEKEAQAKEEVKDGEVSKQEEAKYIDVDFKTGVLDSEVPNRIFQKVLEDNRKFGFEKEIYSTEFFDFVLGLQKVVLGLEGDDETTKTLRRTAFEVGGKATLEVLSKAKANSSLDEHVSILVQAMQNDATGSLATDFLDSWYRDDGFNFLFSLLLECPEARARQSVANLLKFVLVTLKMKEKDYLMEPEDFEVEGDDGKKMTMQRHRALSSRFVVRALELLNSQVAKNWVRFDQFHDLLFTFALADVEDVLPLFQTQQATPNEQAQVVRMLDTESKGARVGLEFFCKVKYIERAGDFMLGRKSPLCATDERRPDLGGAYTHPDFSSVMKLMAALITDEELVAKYPLSGVEREMILHQDLLKTMLGSPTVSKAFGQCLANMCKDNEKLSKKVTKVFLRCIEQAHLDTVKGFLKALKPFLRSDDSLKKQKLEWVFGIPEVVSRKGYGDARCKYGLELVDRINEEAIKFTSPILSGAADEALIAQIVKCKGRFDVQCISCLKELLSLMRKDAAIARFVYHLPPASYQCARFTDWFRPYLEEQLADPQRGSAAQNQYFRNKYDLLAKAVAHLNALAPTFAAFEQEQNAALDQCLEKKEQFSDLATHWAGTNSSEAIRHFPPQLIVGKQVADEQEVFVYDKDPFVKLQIFQLDCEYAYSAPTGLFNLQLPHIEVRTSSYQTQSYEQYKRLQAAGAAKNENADLENEAAEQDQPGNETPSQNDDDLETKKAKAAEERKKLTAETRDWDECKRQGTVLLRVVLTNKSSDKDLKVWYKLGVQNPADKAALNVPLAVASRKTYLHAKNQKIVETLTKVDPSVPFFFKDLDQITIELEATVRTPDGMARGATAKKVHYAQQSHSVGVGGSPANDYDEDDRDDDAEYAGYQTRYSGPTTAYGPYGGPADEEQFANMNLLNLQPQEADADAGRRSNGSTDAVQDEQHAGASRQNSDVSSGPGGYRQETGVDAQAPCDCPDAQATDGFTCDQCGQYAGGADSGTQDAFPSGTDNFQL